MKKITGIIALLFLIVPVAVNAQTSAVQANTSEYSPSVNPSYTLLAPLPCINSLNSGQTCNGNAVTSINLKGYIVYIFELAIAVAVFLAVVMITWGGFKYMTVESVTGKSDAKEIIQNAILGLLGALGSYLILYTINPQLVDLDLITVPKLNLHAASTVAFNQAITTATIQTEQANGAAMTAAKNAGAQAQSNLQNSQTNLNQIQSEIAACDYGTVTCDADMYSDLQNQLATTQQNIATYNNQVTTQSAIQAMNTALVSSASLTNTATNDGASESPAAAEATVANNITTLQNNYIATSNALGNDATDKQTLANQYTYSAATLNDEQAYLQFQADPNSAKTILSTIATQDNLMASEKDPVLQQQYQTYSSQIKATINQENAVINQGTNIPNPL